MSNGTNYNQITLSQMNKIISIYPGIDSMQDLENRMRHYYDALLRIQAILNIQQTLTVKHENLDAFQIYELPRCHQIQDIIVSQINYMKEFYETIKVPYLNLQALIENEYNSIKDQGQYNWQNYQQQEEIFDIQKIAGISSEDILREQQSFKNLKNDYVKFEQQQIQQKQLSFEYPQDSQHQDDVYHTGDENNNDQSFQKLNNKRDSQQSHSPNKEPHRKRNNGKHGIKTLFPQKSHKSKKELKRKRLLQKDAGMLDESHLVYDKVLTQYATQNQLYLLTMQQINEFKIIKEKEHNNKTFRYPELMKVDIIKLVLIADKLDLKNISQIIADKLNLSSTSVQEWIEKYIGRKDTKTGLRTKDYFKKEIGKQRKETFIYNFDNNVDAIFNENDNQE